MWIQVHFVIFKPPSVGLPCSSFVSFCHDFYSGLRLGGLGVLCLVFQDFRLCGDRLARRRGVEGTPISHAFVARLLTTRTEF